MKTLIIYEDNEYIFMKSIITNKIVQIDIVDYYNSIKEFGYKDTMRDIFKELEEYKYTNFYSRELSLMIVTNINCNLFCSYCFEKNCKVNKILNENDAIELVKNLKVIVENRNYDILDISFTGGEPTLNYKFISKFIKLIEETLVDIDCRYSIITNGYVMSSDIINLLNKHKFNVQISFDGYRNFHNMERKDFYGVGSYDYILSNMRKMLSLDNISIQVRLNITKFNYFEINNVLNDLRNLANCKKIKVYFDFLDVPKNNIYYLTEKEKIKISKNIFDIMFVYDFVLPKIYISGGNCMYKNNSSLTINSDKKVYKCYSLVNNKDYEIDYFNKDLNFNGVGSMCDNFSCKVYDFCLGGCPFSKYIIEGVMDKNCMYNYINFCNKYIFKKELEKLTGINFDLNNISIKRLEV